MNKMPDLDCNSANDFFNGFVDLLRSVINDHAPLKRLSRRQQKLRIQSVRDVQCFGQYSFYVIIPKKGFIESTPIN